MSADTSIPTSDIRHATCGPNHDRFAPLLYRLVIAGLVLGGIGFLLATIGSIPGARLVLAGTGAASASVAGVFVLWTVLRSFRPWHGLAAALGCALLLVLFLQSALRLPVVLSGGAPLLKLALELMRFAYIVLSAGLVAVYLSHRLSPVYGLFAALLFLTTPSLAASNGMALWLLFYGSAALLCLFLWSETGKVFWLIAGGLGLGFAAYGVPGEPAYLVLASAPTILFFLGRRTQPWHATKAAAVLVVCGAGLYGVSEGISWALGPARGIVHPLWGDAAASVQHVLDDPSRVTPWSDIVHALFGLALVEERLPDALMVGPAAVCFLPWAFKGKWGQEKRTLFIVALAFVLVAGYGGALKSVGLVPIISLLAALAVYGVHNLYMSVRHPALLFTAVTLVLVWNASILWNSIG